ncbi:MAG: fatty acid desaturase [Deferrisomatales bacterium]|nr:fatty acid desaturase [Deferrisomatales bacterium]
MPEIGYQTSHSIPLGSPPYRWPDWHRSLKRFETRDARRAAWQLVDTFVPYLLLWFLMVRSIQLGYPYILTLLLAVPAAGLLVRLFILFHDCVHSSFFASSRANTVLGYLCGTLTFTPLEDWRFTHLRHHATYANLDARGVGDITTLTVEEYLRLPWARRLKYRLYRNPLVLFGAGPLFYFLLRQRWPSRAVSKIARRSVWLTNLLIAAVAISASWAIGLGTYLLIQVPVLWLGGAGGIWLFYVQHQFEGVYWSRKDAWDPLRAAVAGSSFYRLPAVLRWFSGSIGIHFIHHLASRIPNYNLQRCYDGIPELHAKEPLTLRKSLASPRLKLWDEERRELVGFSALQARAPSGRSL